MVNRSGVVWLNHRKTLCAVMMLLAVAAILVFRNARLFTYPEPWAEDFNVFILAEYNTGFPASAFIPYAGYIHLIPRILTWIALNLMVLLFKIWLVWLVYRSEEIKNTFIKYSLLAYLIFLPFADEIYNNVTNLQWWLIPLMALLIVRQEHSNARLAADTVALALLGLTGVNSVLFAVPCAYLFLRNRNKQCFIKASAVGICSLIQFYYLMLLHRVGNINLLYEGGVIEIIHMFVNRVIYHTFLHSHCKTYINLVVFALYVLLAAFVFYYYRRNALVHFIYLFTGIYSFAIFYSLIKPTPDITFLINGFAGERYFVYLRICTFILIISATEILLRMIRPKHFNRLIFLACFCLCAVLLKNYHVGFPFEDQFYGEVQKFEAAKPGETVKFHFPPGWSSDLVI